MPRRNAGLALGVAAVAVGVLAWRPPAPSSVTTVQASAAREAALSGGPLQRPSFLGAVLPAELPSVDRHPPPPAPVAPAPVPAKSPVRAASPGHVDTYTATLPPRRYVSPPSRPPPVSYGSHHGYPTALLCVAWTENGGSYGRSSNPTHFGRYQFDAATWQAYGGSPSTWGVATPAEQDAVFARAVAAGDLYHGWLEWDHC